MYEDFLFVILGMLLILLDWDIGPCVELNQLFLLYGISAIGLFIFC